MTRDEQRLLAEAGADRTNLLIRTGARVDTGHWFRQTRVWIACLPRELVLVAAGKHPFVTRLPCAGLRASTYNPLTGELVLTTEPGHPGRRLRMAPLDGIRVLQRIRGEL